MKRIELSILLSLVFCAVVSLLSFDGECGAVRDNVLRLRVVANSDALEDQELKLRVRDRLLELSAEELSGCENMDEARAVAQSMLLELTAAAENEIKVSGYDYSVNVTLDRSFFETRDYGAYTMPAGTYDCVKVEIGRAEGRNWWCVMFPALCVPDKEAGERFAKLLDEGQIEIIKNEGFDVRFKCVEWYEGILCFLGLSD